MLMASMNINTDVLVACMFLQQKYFILSNGWVINRASIGHSLFNETRDKSEFLEEGLDAFMCP